MRSAILLCKVSNKKTVFSAFLRGLHEGILGTIFTGRLIRETKVGEYPAVVPTLTGQAWITGFAQYMVDPEDPFPNGFTVGDIWGAQTD